MSDVRMRRAQSSDAAVIAAIYNHYIATSTATFDTIGKTVEEREAWLEQHGDAHPVLVAERDGVVVGWGALTPWGVRPGWAHTAEVTVYLAPDATGQGIGAVVLSALVEAARVAGHHALLSQIVAENTASLTMTERVGFERVGYLRSVGRKFDRWIDLVVMELVL
ncbi:MAG: GNAT family N-acetyltransferase [Actinobacteria bacterium HGW-Actinobacteria-7]|nr:MAG: GNAT family N-acetyltransferase [Actinobacteria bacterium HGW-Actinobacteria-7]